MSSQRPHHAAWGVALLVGLTLIAVVLAGHAMTRVRSHSASGPGAGAQTANVAANFGHRPTLLVVGDSFAAGVDAESMAYPRLIGDIMNWNVIADAQGGTGFTNPGLHGLIFADRLVHQDDAASYKVDYILVDGGRNDGGAPPDVLVTAVDSYLHQLRATWPKAKIIVMMPSFIANHAAGPRRDLLIGQMSESARSVGADVIDPVGEGWYDSIDLKSILWQDNIHPNAAGQEYYAERIIRDLKRLGIAG